MRARPTRRPATTTTAFGRTTAVTDTGVATHDFLGDQPSESGHNSRTGYGMINPAGALTARLPGQDVIARDTAIGMPFEMPRGWTPVEVAVIGSGGGLGLLLALFIVHTVRRQRRDRAGSA